ncbi:protein roadkill-like [Trichogramma pretiosum]|uniref:protein roadkill-like n=1 Tax=Trichogramma pretiosum TaxID=7493 RepID=UPI0006C9B59F|nr:protein roadkill-like [Trichogramma pretiosum]
MSSKRMIEASTTVTSKECIYTWTIKNYRLIQLNVGEAIKSPKFGVESDNDKCFELHLYPQGIYEKTSEFIGLAVLFTPDATKKPDKLLCRCTLSAINDKRVVRKGTYNLDFATKPYSGSEKFFSLKSLNNLISSQNTVTIRCEIEIFKRFESSLDSEIIDDKDDKINNVKLDSLFLSTEFSDVELITSDENHIPAHRAILAVSSPVFKAMFTHDMLEKKCNYVTITDIPYNILVEMLRYIYTGDIVSTKTNVVLEILAVADKYQIENLKIKCGKMLNANLSPENAIQILLAAQKYNAEHLESKVQNFLKLNSKSTIDPKNLNKMTKPVLVKLLQSFMEG